MNSLVKYDRRNAAGRQEGKGSQQADVPFRPGAHARRFREDYFRSGRRVCLVGALALGDARDRFAGAVRSYFARWIAALAGALAGPGRDRAEAVALAEETVAGIQGAIVLARALDDPGAFGRTLAKLRARMETA